MWHDLYKTERHAEKITDFLCKNFHKVSFTCQKAASQPSIYELVFSKNCDYYIILIPTELIEEQNDQEKMEENPL